MKKSLMRGTAAALVLSLGLSAAACDTGGTTPEATTTTTASTTTEAGETETPTEDETDAPTEGNTEEPTEDETDEPGGETDEPGGETDEPTEDETDDPNEGPGAGDSTHYTNEVDNTGVYPLEGNVTLTYWSDLNNNVAASFQSLGDTPLYQELMERTGVQLEFSHPGAGQAAEALSLLLATQDYPDLIESNWLTYSGGPSKAIGDNVIIELNDILDNHSPNLRAYLDAHPDVDRMVRTDEGKYYAYPFIRGHEDLLVSSGVIVRKDWLDDLGLGIPETVDDWYTALTAFKDEKGATAPLTYELYMLNWGHWTNPYGVLNGFYIDDNGDVQYGAMQEGYREFLETYSQWYAEGLIDPDLASVDASQTNAKMTSGQSGVSMGWMASRMGVWTTAARETDPNYELAGAPVPVMNQGDPKRFGSYDFPYAATSSVAITTSSEHVETAARFLDYAYSNEGHILFNFGIEGESYDWVDDYPQYRDEMYNDPDGRPLATMLGQYIRANYSGPIVQDPRYIEQYVPLPEQKTAYRTWSDTDASQHLMPPITATPEESTELATIMSEITDYRDEMFLSYLFGNESLDSFDNYVENITNMNIARAIEIQTAALDRYYNR